MSGLKFDCCLTTCKICCYRDKYHKCKLESTCDELTFKQVTFEDKTGKNIGNRQVISVVNGMYRT